MRRTLSSYEALARCWGGRAAGRSSGNGARSGGGHGAPAVARYPRAGGGGLLNRRWGDGAPPSLRREACRPLHCSTASTLGRRALTGEAATDRRAKQCTDGGEVEGSTWHAQTSRASVRARPRGGVPPREVARGPDTEVSAARARRATSRGAASVGPTL
jgi:hypothetical protein